MLNMPHKITDLFFFTHMEFPWYACQLPATYSPAYAYSFSTVGSQRKLGSISQMCSYYVQHDLQLIEDVFSLLVITRSTDSGAPQTLLNSDITGMYRLSAKKKKKRGGGSGGRADRMA